MASGPTLPPQAYTREILTAAFNWLQSQPDSVRKLATTPDALVGLYMRAQRFGNSNLETDAPVSGQNFMSDLKNLAEGLKQFEGDQKVEPRIDLHGAAPRADVRSDLRELREMRRSQIAPQAHSPATPQGSGAYVHSATQHQIQQQTHYQTPVAAPLAVQGPANFVTREVALAAMSTVLNERSVAMIQDVKSQLNLSSDAEAVNMMLSLAYKSLKNLIV